VGKGCEKKDGREERVRGTGERRKKRVGWGGEGEGEEEEEYEHQCPPSYSRWITQSSPVVSLELSVLLIWLNVTSTCAVSVRHYVALGIFISGSEKATLFACIF
jgi:hypothetical protein